MLPLRSLFLPLPFPLSSTAAVALLPLIGVSFFPQAEKPQFLVNVTTPEGSSRAATDRAVRRVERWLDGRDDIRRYAANVGRDNPMVHYNVTPRGERPTAGQVYVEATSADRVPTIASELEADLGDVPGVDYDTEIFKNGPPVEAPVAIKIIGPELPTLRTLAADVEATIEQTPGTRNVDNPLASDLANVIHQSLLSLGSEMVVSRSLSAWRLSGSRGRARYNIM